MADGENAVFTAVRAAADEYDADIFLFSATVDHSSYGKLVKCFPAERRTNAILILTTHGGLANSAFQIARFLQNHYREFSVFIPAFCKSAGTMIALGAHRLVMTPFSELGPLDVQLYERDEIGARKSGLLSHSSFEALKRETFDLYEHILLSIKQRSGDNISFSLASEVASDVSAKVMAPIYEQISASILGSDYRDLRVAIEYGRRLASVSGNIETPAIEWLTEHYPSHDFIIDAVEAEELFAHVDSPHPSLYELTNHFSEYVFIEREEGIVICLNEALLRAEENGNGEAQTAADSEVDNMADIPAPDRAGPRGQKPSRKESVPDPKR